MSMILFLAILTPLCVRILKILWGHSKILLNALLKPSIVTLFPSPLIVQRTSLTLLHLPP